MAIEIRPASSAEMEEYRRTALSALVLPPQKAAADAILGIHPEMTLCAFVDGRLASSYGAWPMKMRINGGSVSTAGVTFVGTLPVYRRQGLLRRIVKGHFELLHQRGEQPLTALVASQAAIYHRYGYAVVTTRNSYRIEPGFIRFIRPVSSAAGRLSEVAEAQTEVLHRLYRSFCEERTGYLHRGRATWATGVLRPPPEKAVLFKVIYEEAGRPSGYIVYTVEPLQVPDGTPWQTIYIRDLVWLSAPAYTALWNHMAGFELAEHVHWTRVPSDDPLPHLLLEPRRLNMAAADGLLARIVDAEKLMPLRRYEGEGRLAFELLDELCPWNAGNWELEAGEAGAVLRRTSRPAQVRLPVDTLAMLFFGQISASEASRMGRLDLLADNALPQWDRMLRTRYQPFCPDFF